MSADPVELKYLNNPLALLNCPVVQLQGLVNRPELNGKFGLIIADTKLGRYYVRVFFAPCKDRRQELPRTLSIKRQNMTRQITWQLLPIHTTESCRLCQSIIRDEDSQKKTNGYQECCGQFLCTNCDIKKNKMFACPLCKARLSKNAHDARARALDRLFRFGDFQAVWAVALSLRSSATDAYPRIQTLAAGLGHRIPLFEIASEQNNHQLLQALSSDSFSSPALRNQAAAAALRTLH